MSNSEIINGSRTSFGRRFSEKKAAHVLPQTAVKTLIVPFNFDDLPGVGASVDDASYSLLPANSHIVSSKVYVKDAFVGGTTYDVGLHEQDGTVIDATGIHAGLAVGVLTAEAWVNNTGALVGTGGIGNAAAQVTIVATGAFTAGKGQFVIQYLTPVVSS